MSFIGSTPPVLSIIVPTFNYAEYLEKCLFSVLSQFSKATELIVVDDGSTDNTKEVLRNLSQAYEGRFFHVCQENRGAASARNHGIRLCHGDFILFLDADDELLPGTIDTVHAYLENHPDVDLVIGRHINHMEDGRERISIHGHFKDDPCARVTDYLIHKRIGLYHGSFVVRKKLLEQRPYAESFRTREDTPVFAHLLAHARIACIEHIMVRINKHASSLRHRDFDENVKNPESLVVEVFKSLPESCQPIRRSYAAIRYQAAFRNALSRRSWREARRLFIESVRQDWYQGIRFTHIRKAVRALLMHKR